MKNVFDKIVDEGRGLILSAVFKREPVTETVNIEITSQFYPIGEEEPFRVIVDEVYALGDQPDDGWYCVHDGGKIRKQWIVTRELITESKFERIAGEYGVEVDVRDGLLCCWCSAKRIVRKIGCLLQAMTAIDAILNQGI
jgi:hypothetical protein